MRRKIMDTGWSICTESGEKQKEEKQGIGVLLFKIRIDCQLSIKNRIPFALGE